MLSITEVTAFWDSRPCNSRHSLASMRTPEYMLETEKRKYFVEPHIPAFAEFWKYTGKRVLEIGCGIGIDTANFVRWGAEVAAIDLSQKSLDIADARVHLLPWTAPQTPERPWYRDGRASFWKANAEDQIWNTNSDLVYAFGSIHHSPNPEKILNNARQSLKPGGTLKIMVYNAFSWKSLWVMLKYGKGKFWRFREIVARYSEAQTGCPITHLYSRKTARRLVESAGFTIKKISVAHIFPWKISDYREYRYVKAFPWSICPDWLFRLLEHAVGWHILIEATA